MAEKSAESTVGKYLGAPITGALTGLVTWATAGWTGAIGSAMVALLAILGGICGLTLTLDLQTPARGSRSKPTDSSRAAGL
jgi:hypothetical protein